jgi:CBS domain-containing protein
MRETKVKEIMSKYPVLVKTGDSVKKVAEMLAEKNVAGAPVVDDKGNLIGMVTDTDLVMEDVRLHFPSYLHLLDSYIFLQGLGKFENELKKAVGATVQDVMTRDIVKVTEDQTVEDAATLMVDKDVDVIPVVSDGKVVGVVTKSDIVRLISRS